MFLDVSLRIKEYVSVALCGHTLTLIISFMRSTMRKCSFPSGDRWTRTSSPVFNQRPSVCHTNAPEVALSSSRYPRVTDGDCSSSSPWVLWEWTSLPSVSMILALVPGIRDPDEPGRGSSSLVLSTSADDSVKPRQSVILRRP